MIETPLGVLAAAGLAAVPGVGGLIAGVNDLRVTLGIPADGGREGLSLALQTIVLAARASDLGAGRRVQRTRRSEGWRRNAGTGGRWV
jgi:(3S)-malyl-CoA thioesterase